MRTNTFSDRGRCHLKFRKSLFFSLTLTVLKATVMTSSNKFHSNSSKIMFVTSYFPHHIFTLDFLCNLNSIIFLEHSFSVSSNKVIFTARNIHNSSFFLAKHINQNSTMFLFPISMPKWNRNECVCKKSNPFLDATEYQNTAHIFLNCYHIYICICWKKEVKNAHFPLIRDRDGAAWGRRKGARKI